jgi:hypothetical protein
MAARDSTKRALEAYYQKLADQHERSLKPKRKNGKPELAVRSACMEWLRLHKFGCHVVESKAVYSKSAGRYLSGQTTAGFSDITGVTPSGLGCFIEVKRKGARSTLKAHQRYFLISKIELFAFAVCVDSVAMLETIYGEFEYRRKMEPQLAMALLLRHLPTEREGEQFSID